MSSGHPRPPDLYGEGGPPAPRVRLTAGLDPARALDRRRQRRGRFDTDPLRLLSDPPQPFCWLGLTVGFTWGFHIVDREIALDPSRMLAAPAWNEHVETLGRTHPGWHFSLGFADLAGAG